MNYGNCLIPIMVLDILIRILFQRTDKLTEVEKAARAAFDKMLTDLQGDVMNEAAGSGNGESYWSSTENAAGNQAYWVRFGKSGADAGNKTATNVL